MDNGQKWIAFSTIVRREINRFMRIWPQTLVPPVITIVLYFVIFGKFLIIHSILFLLLQTSHQLLFYGLYWRVLFLDW